MNIRVRLKKSQNYNYYGVSYESVVTLDIEEYLRGVIPSENYASWPAETLKAQSVAARSYALYKKNGASGEAYDVEDTANYQSFTITKKDSRTTAAVDATAGQVLYYGSSLAETLYTASNGGRCRSSVEAGWNARPYLISKDDPWTEATGEPHMQSKPIGR